MELTVLVPVYNETRRLPRSIGALLKFVNTFPPGEAELLLVDDGSADGTFALAQKYAREHAAVRALQLPAHAGKGAAVRAGAVAARGRAALLCDCDLATSPEEYARFAALMREHDADIVIGSRRVADSNVVRPQSAVKSFLGKCANALIFFTTGMPHKDTGCGFKLFGPRALLLFPHSVLNAAGQDIEILFLARLAKLRVVETGVRWAHDPDSRFGAAAYFIALAELARLRLRAWRGGYRGACVDVNNARKNDRAN